MPEPSSWQACSLTSAEAWSWDDACANGWAQLLVKTEPVASTRWRDQVQALISLSQHASNSRQAPDKIECMSDSGKVQHRRNLRRRCLLVHHHDGTDHHTSFAPKNMLAPIFFSLSPGSRTEMCSSGTTPGLQWCTRKTFSGELKAGDIMYASKFIV